MIDKRLINLETQLFESLSNARKLYSSKIPDYVFNELVKIDPSKTFKYIEKLCKFYIELPRINIVRLKQEIESFDKLSSKNLIDVKDINKFNTYYQFSSYLDKNSDRMSKSEERNLIKNEGSEVILNNSEFLVLLIKDEKASIQYGAGTKWCIAARDDNYFKSYRRERVTFYFLFQKNLDSSNPNYKIAVAVYPDGKKEVYLADDSLVTFSVISELRINEDLFKPLGLGNEEILDSCINGTYKINSRGEIDVDGNVNLRNQNLSSIRDLGQFGTVIGYFDCSVNKLKNLRGSPKEVSENFLAKDNNLISLIGCPEKVHEDFSVENNKIISLDYSPDYVRKSFRVNSNNLKTLFGFPKHCGGRVWIQDNNLTSLEYISETIFGDFSADGEKIKSLEYFPKEIKGELRLWNSKVTEEEIREVCFVKGEIFLF